jgi:hypothetical protein
MIGDRRRRRSTVDVTMKDANGRRPAAAALGDPRGCYDDDW